MDSEKQSKFLYINWRQLPQNMDKKFEKHKENNWGLKEEKYYYYYYYMEQVKTSSYSACAVRTRLKNYIPVEILTFLKITGIINSPQKHQTENM
jgi:hypothetical protein